MPHLLVYRALLLQGEGPAGLDLVQTARLPSWNIAGDAGIVGLSKEGAVCSERLAVLLEHVGVEEAASVLAVATSSSGTVADVLSRSVGSAKLWVEWTREEVLLDAGGWVRVSTLVALLWVGPSWWGDWGGCVGLGVSV